MKAQNDKQRNPSASDLPGRSRRKKKTRVSRKIGLLFLLLAFLGAVFYFIYPSRQTEEPFFTSLASEKDHIIQWTDSVLEERIRGIIRKREGDIYLSDIWSCSGLNLGRTIDYIDDTPQITGEIINDISSLAGLVNLRSLNLSYHNVTDISAVQSMVSMQNLTLNGNHIQDLSALESLPYLGILDLRNTHIQGSELEHLAGLKHLYMLYLDFNEIESLESLEGISPVYLSASMNRLTDITPLSTLGASLDSLDLTENQITNIEPLSQFKKLTFLNLRDNTITDITALRKLRKLDWLNLRNNQIVSLPNLSGMVSLKTLYLENNRISTEEWKKVKLPWGICKVYLTGNPITDLETEREYPNLEVIFD